MRVEFTPFEKEDWARPHSASADGPHIEASPVCIVRVICSYAEVARAGGAGHEAMADLVRGSFGLLETSARVRIDQELESRGGEYSLGKVQSDTQYVSTTAEVAVLAVVIWRIRGVRHVVRDDVERFFHRSLQFGRSGAFDGPGRPG